MDQSKSCPLGHTCSSCHWLVRMRGVDPTSGQEIDDDKCAIAWLPILLVENSQQQRSTSHAVESFRNEMVNSNEVIAQVMIANLNKQHDDHPKLVNDQSSFTDI